MPTYRSTNPLARTSPLRSIPLYQAPGRIVPMTDLAKAEWALAIAVRDPPIFEQRYAVACAALGDANRMRGSMRRYWQAKAFRSINAARAQLRAGRRALEAAQTAVQLAAPVVPAA